MSPSVDTELVAVQRLHIRLLYCARTVAEYQADPVACLERYGLPASWREMLPDTRSEGHRTELRGRRIQATLELLETFRATFERLFGAPMAVADVAQAPWLTRFLSSEEFFEPQWSLPHVTGIGRAYEGYSRFFFWARREFRMRDPDADPMLRDDLYLDFAARLDSQQVTATSQEWEWLRHGFFWVRVPGTGGPCRGLSAERKVFSAEATDSAHSLRAAGLCDLDTLKP